MLGYATVYRKISHEDRYAIVLIFPQNEMPEGVIWLPAILASMLKASLDKEVKLEKIPIQLSERKDALPDFPVANKIEISSVYGRIPSIFNEVALMAVTKGPAFIVSTNQEIQIDLSQIDKSLAFDEKLSTKRAFERFIKRSSKEGLNFVIRLIVTSIDVIVEGRKFSIYSTDRQPERYFIFEPGHTMVKLDQTRLNRLNYFDFRTILPYEKYIYSMEPYANLRKIIYENKHTRYPIFVYYSDGLGITNFLRNVTDSNLMHFHHLDCYGYYGLSGISTFLNESIKAAPCLCVLHNVDWINELLKMNVDSVWMSKKHIYNFIKLFVQYYGLNDYEVILIMTYRSDTIDLKLMEGHHYKLSCEIKEKEDMRGKMLESEKERWTEEQYREIVEASKSMGWADLQQQLSIHNFDEMMKKIKDISKKIVTAKIPDVKWSDVGGLEDAKNEIIDTIILPKNHPYLFDRLIRPRTGLLFYGPPGTGKTLLAKCIANECQMNFISVKGPYMLNMYIGESEKNVRNTFERAAANRPCIIFFDELDALAPKRGSSADSSQVMDRIVGELLTQMDMCGKIGGIFVFGATNRPDLLDPSVLRPGRFDKQIYLGISATKEERIKILEAQTQKLKLLEDVNFKELVDMIPKNFTGADFYGLTTKAVMTAVRRTTEQIEQGNDIKEVIVEQSDFLEAARECKPSVTEKDLERYEKLKNTYS